MKELVKEEWFWIAVVGLLGWILAVLQFTINRCDQKKDKLVDRKYEAYSSRLNKFDEAMQNVQKDPANIVKAQIDIFSTLINNMGDQAKINEALIKHNQEIMSFIPNSTEPLIILKNELNYLKLICSNELKQKIDELITLTQDYNNEIQKTLSLVSPNDLNSSMQKLQTLGQNKRWQMFESLNSEIIMIMRKEIGSDKR
ncbi:hypothetical protein FACS1894190_03710 [Spirochaetia bacterium]|nr:hypothetical protein FACS1894190_03710 [Spirochaetia bacterium]